MKIILTFLSVFIFNILQADNIYVSFVAENTDIQPAIQAAVNIAQPGDQVVIPYGTYILNKSVYINKDISIRGRGVLGTVLYRSENVKDSLINLNPSWNCFFKIDINSTKKTNIVIRTLYFKSKIPSIVEGDKLSKALDFAIIINKCVGFKILYCKFENFGNAAVEVIHDDSIANGLISGNTFVHNVKGYDGQGYGYGVVVYGTNNRWILNPHIGSSNFIFVENNTFTYHRHSIAAGGCALYVFRYNKVYNNVAGNAAHAIDAHEARLTRGENYYSTRAYEIYNNTLINYTYRDGTTNVSDGTLIKTGTHSTWLTECGIRPRGGEGVIFNNLIKGYRFGVGIVADGIFKTSYPIPYQQGYLSASYGTGDNTIQSQGDVFIWENSFQKSDSYSYPFYNYSPSYLAEERDYHLHPPKGYTPYYYPYL